MEFEFDAADGIKTVKVTLLRLARMGSRYERVTIEVDPSDRIDICGRSKQLFRDADPLQWPDWYVTHATLRIVFHPEPGRTREKTVSINCEHLTVRTCEIRLGSIKLSHRSIWRSGSCSRPAGESNGK